MSLAGIPQQTLGRWLFRPASPTALAAVRIATNGYALWYTTKRWKLITKTAAGPKRDFKPVGVVRPLRRPLPVGVVKATTAATYATTALAGLGVAYPVIGPLNTVANWWTLTYRNSWSMVFHSDNLPVLHLTALGVAPAADALSVDSLIRGTRGLPTPSRSWKYGWPLQTVNVVTAATYFLCGVAKLRGPLGLRWAKGEHLRSQVAVDGARKAALKPDTEAEPNPYVALIERNPELWTMFAAGSLLMELAAPLALINPRAGRLWSVGAWSMHLGIKLIMKITFRYQLSGVPYIPMATAPQPR